jgi:MurNAc alpha-1-phosphate uridylyltransferase
MPDSLAAIVLAAGSGTRLRPLTRLRPKALCPVGGVPLVDLAIERVTAVTDDVAVNVHAGRDQLVAHLDGRVHLSIEAPEALGTAGAVVELRPWLDGRPVLVVNGDAWHTADLGPLVEGWDGERVRLIVAGDPGTPFGPRMRIVGSLLPPADVAALPDGVSGLSVVSWRPALEAGRLDVVGADVPFVDCGTPASYLAANLLASGGRSVVGEGAAVAGELVRSVVWDGATVGPGERLVDAIRADEGVSVLVR